MNPENTTLVAPARLVTVTVEAKDADPMLFLRMGKGGPRGFWAKADRWVAHNGTIASLSENGSSSMDRFSAIGNEAHNLIEAASGVCGELESPIRFYGGFSFRSDHSAVDLWKGFKPALFHLPEFELEGGHLQSPRLTARAIVGPDDGDTDKILEVLSVKVRQICKRLQEMEPGDIKHSHAVSTLRSESERNLWDSAVNKALSAIAKEEVYKVVLARTMDVVTEEHLDHVTVLKHLWEENHGSHVFLFEPESGCPLLGATPETLAAMSSGVFHATAVAGTIARGGTLAEQEALAASLLASKKDGVEHKLALEDMMARLEPLAQEVHVQPEPHVLTLSRIQHLETEIRAIMPEGTSVLEILESLHATAAVCGLPRDKALEFLDREEPFERGWYAGPVGWFDLEGNGSFAPALRCALARGYSWRLFAGAGIVAGSDPSLEWYETNMKFEPVLQALAASGAQ
tara:strand:- start:2346 stop:3722 length:1377 start_codon:yes stop_codon:yes gene_type:complete